ncbi:MAG: hypothetical protein HUU35_00435 [Armatimonadetes bacterium]|nr:hypothetical protein [Armatimonadota bacterium]
MRPLDGGFMERVLGTSVGLGSLILLPLLAGPAAPPLSLAAGLAACWLVWQGTLKVGRAVTGHAGPWHTWQVLGLVGVYGGKYAAVAAGIWLLERSDLLHAVGFAIGASLPSAVAALKACGRLLLPPECDPVPVYARVRKASHED